MTNALFTILDGIISSDCAAEILASDDAIVNYAEAGGDDIDYAAARRIQTAGRNWLDQQANGNGEWSRMRHEAAAELEAEAKADEPAEAFADSADSRETSKEIIDAILAVAGNSDAEAVRVWEAPTEAEALAVWERVTKNGLRDSADYCWGASGSDWAAQLGIVG